jgi:hypothetical protein
MQLFVRNRRPTASLSTSLYLSVSAIREPSLGEYLWDIENSPLETARPELPIRARSAKISTLRDRLSSANVRKYREHFRYMKVRYGDGTGWLGREDSNRQMQILNPLRRLFSAVQILCRVIHFAWHILDVLPIAMIGDFLARSNGFGFLTPKSRHRFRSRLPLMSAANAAKAGCKPLILLSGAPEGIRTPNPRSLTGSKSAAHSRFQDTVAV